MHLEVAASKCQFAHADVVAACARPSCWSSQAGRVVVPVSLGSLGWWSTMPKPGMIPYDRCEPHALPIERDAIHHKMSFARGDPKTITAHGVREGEGHVLQSQFLEVEVQVRERVLQLGIGMQRLVRSRAGPKSRPEYWRVGTR